MKKYFVNVHFDMVVRVEVDAENDADALEKAYEKAGDAMPNEMECVGWDACIC